MATEATWPYPVALSEVRTFPLSFADDLQSGVTVSTAAGTQTPPEGSEAAALAVTCTVATPIVNAKVGPHTVTGWHRIDVLATLSDGDKAALRLNYFVKF